MPLPPELYEAFARAGDTSQDAIRAPYDYERMNEKANWLADLFGVGSVIRGVTRGEEPGASGLADALSNFIPMGKAGAAAKAGVGVLPFMASFKPWDFYEQMLRVPRQEFPNKVTGLAPKELRSISALLEILPKKHGLSHDQQQAEVLRWFNKERDNMDAMDDAVDNLKVDFNEWD